MLPLLLLFALLGVGGVEAAVTLIGRIHVWQDDEGHPPEVLLNSTAMGFVQLFLTDEQAAMRLSSGMFAKITADSIDLGHRSVSPSNIELLQSIGGKIAAAGSDGRFHSITYIVTPCGVPSEASQNGLNANYFKRYAKNGDPTLEGWFETCSFGSVSFDEASNAIVGPITIPCSGTSMQGYTYSSRSCTWEDRVGWLDVAQEKARLLGYVPENYAHQIMIIPDSNYIPCYWAGISDLGCGAGCLSIIHADAAGVLGAITHELGHSMYLAHSAMNGVEYLDTTSAMGAHCCQPACYNAPQTWSMGWSFPSQVFDGNSITAGRWYNVVVPEFVTTRFNFVQIFPTWTGSQLPGIYLSYKLDVGYNAGINPNGKRYGGKLLINTFARMNNSGTYDISVMPNLEALLLPGEQYVMGWASLTLISQSGGDGDSMQASFCRSDQGVPCNSYGQTGMVATLPPPPSTRSPSPLPPRSPSPPPPPSQSPPSPSSRGPSPPPPRSPSPPPPPSPSPPSPSPRSPSPPPPPRSPSRLPPPGPSPATQTISSPTLLPSPPHPPPLPTPFPTGTPSRCAYNLVSDSSWCAMAQGAWGIGSLEECAQHCVSTVASTVATFCFDFNVNNRHCECAQGPEISKRSPGYASYTYTCS